MSGYSNLRTDVSREKFGPTWIDILIQFGDVTDQLEGNQFDNAFALANGGTMTPFVRDAFGCTSSI